MTNLSSDIGPLKRVLVHRPGPETLKVTTALHGDHPMLANELLPNDGPLEHEQFVRALSASGAEILFLEDVLNEAISAADAAGQFGIWLDRRVPGLRQLADIDAQVLLGATDEVAYNHLADPMKWIYYTRDFATMTPRGAAISRFINNNRRFEADLIRFAFEWAPTLSKHPIAFDAEVEGLYLQGGDMIVVDKHTLLVGVGSLTQRETAQRLAQRLEVDVIAVQMVGLGTNGLRSLFLHLDTVFNLVDEKKALAVPYFFEQRFAGDEPLTDLLLTMGATDIAQGLRDFGSITKFLAGSGEIDSGLTGMKLVDHLTDIGYAMVWVGGDAPSERGTQMTKHVIENVLREVHFQGGNVVATKPGSVIAYQGNEGTLQALADADIEVTTIDGRSLVRWNGGPHCMTCPIERD
ncbi:MAG: arginine deiminase family protein [Actinomycetota bacterium]